MNFPLKLRIVYIPKFLLLKELKQEQAAISDPLHYFTVNNINILNKYYVKISLHFLFFFHKDEILKSS